ncbi:MAG: hypothetical protein O2816_07355 [Planctomycetota bacterium]|nr:hypothetical protein [Planctomycetota bacterium]
MSLDLDHPAIASALTRVHPHLVKLCSAAGERALALHSDEVTPEHLLDACMRDEDCAAYELVTHAFADPETLSFELAALCPGVMVVGSKAALPFSAAAVDALRAARQNAIAASASEVEAGVVLTAVIAALPDELRGLLGATPIAPTPGTGGLDPEGSIFRGFSEDAKSALSHANRAAFAKKEPSISPAQLVLALLGADASLAERAGLAPMGVRNVLSGKTLDRTAPHPRRLAPDSALAELLAALPEGASSLDLWREAQRSGSAELQALFDRHKITASLLDRAEGAFHDPSD